jgi:hypothetical protein
MCVWGLGGAHEDVLRVIANVEVPLADYWGTESPLRAECHEPQRASAGELVHANRLQLPLLDPQIPREIRH